MHCACVLTCQLYCCKVTRTSTAARRARRSRTARHVARKWHGFIRCSQSSQPEPDSSSDEGQALQDWRSFRANLVALERANSALTVELNNSPKVRPCWVHELTQPEAGCLLLAKLESMGTFTHTAVLLCQHDALGSSGFIINMPLARHLLDISTDLQLTDSLQEKQLFLGGPCSTGAANVLHTCDKVQGATQIVEGLHVGGLEDINRLSRLGQIETGAVQVLVGCTAWNPGQLQKEIWLGCWHVLAASHDVLHNCLFGQCEQDNNVHRDLVWRSLLTQAGIDPDTLYKTDT